MIDADVEEMRVDEVAGVEDAEVSADSLEEVSVLRATEDVEVASIEGFTSEEEVEGALLFCVDVAST